MVPERLARLAAFPDAQRAPDRHTVLVTERLTEYCVDRDLVDAADAARACQAVIEVVLPRVHEAWIDAISDEKDLPAAVRTVQDALVRVGRPQGRGADGFGVQLDVRQSDHVRLLRAFAPWSIGVELYDAAMVWVAYFSDTGSSVCFNVTEAEAVAIQAALGSLPMVMVSELKARKR